jgi:predicted nucleic acid-binding protein
MAARQARRMQILFDTNVLLDVLLDRQPWVMESKQLWDANDQGKIFGYLTASSLTDIFYIARRHAGHARAIEAVRICLEGFRISSVDQLVLETALSLHGKDFEDNLQIACAQRDGLDAIVTRDKAGFTHSKVVLLTPAELIRKL